jgi:hypothetical protein
MARSQKSIIHCGFKTLPEGDLHPLHCKQVRTGFGDTVSLDLWGIRVPELPDIRAFRIISKTAMEINGVLMLGSINGTQFHVWDVSVGWQIVDVEIAETGHEIFYKFKVPRSDVQVEVTLSNTKMDYHNSRLSKHLCRA